ncbi:Uhrf1-Binding Protein 1-Like [Manis pentadactyla]|nr:Uhrf1-Binding Protein 1-Like [Manis pentadactyla]
MTDIEADGVGSETLALRKELGSGSDVTGSARCWNRFMLKVKCEILRKGLGLALVGDGQIELHVYGGMTDIEADGVGSGQIDLDHHGVALVTSMLTLRMQLKGSCLGVGYSVRDISITERVRFWVLCDGECKMLEQGYGDVNADAECPG